MTKKRVGQWASRIIGEGEEDPEQLLANPDNVRIHPVHQQQALESVLDRVGWIQRIIVNKRTGFVVDGHLRVMLAISRQEPSIPVLYVDLTAEEEALLLLSYDPIGALAVTDQKKYDELFALVPDDVKALAVIAKGTKEVKATTQLVQFEAKVHHHVLVECKDESDQLALMDRLTSEGYICMSK